MPNWCDNKLRVSGTATDVKRFAEAVRGVDDGKVLPLDFDKLIPQPADLMDRDSCGVLPSWYDWRVANWGTKWNVTEDTAIEPFDGGLLYLFNTAWNPPIEVIEVAAKQFPDLAFEISYIEEDEQVEHIHRFNTKGEPKCFTV